MIMLFVWGTGNLLKKILTPIGVAAPTAKGVCGKTTVSVLHDAQLLLNKQQQIWGDIYIQ